MNLEPTFELVKQAQAGDAQAFGRLIERYRTRLSTLVGIRLGPALAGWVQRDDIVQESSLQAFRSISSFKWADEGSFFRWLAGIVEHVIQNKAREHLKIRKHGVSLDSPGDLLSGSEGRPRLEVIPDPDGFSPLRRLLRQERFDRLKKALQSLSPDHREVIILARLQGLPMAEIAGRMERSVDAVSMLLLRALRELRRSFGTTGSLGLPDLSLDPRPEDPPSKISMSEARGSSAMHSGVPIWKTGRGYNGTTWPSNGSTRLRLSTGI